MYGANGAETFWLNLTNVALGLVTLACVLAIGAGVVRELSDRRRKHTAKADDHAFATPELGLTMADGGRRIDRAEQPTPKRR